MSQFAASTKSQLRCVVVVTFNSGSDIAACLRSLRDERVVLVDNASTDDTIAIVDKFSGPVHVIANGSNRGFAAAANQGMRAAGQTDIALVNPDVSVGPGTLDRLAYTADRQGAGIVVPCLTYPDGASQESTRSFPTLYHLLARRTRLRETSLGRQWHLDSLPSCRKSPVQPVDWAIGALMYIPRSALARTGGFDEKFFVYGEDVDLCARMWRSGLPVLLDIDATATHRYVRSSRRTFDFRQPATRYHWASICRLAYKYPRQFFLNQPVLDCDGTSPELYQWAQNVYTRSESR